MLHSSVREVFRSLFAAAAITCVPLDALSTIGAERSGDQPSIAQRFDESVGGRTMQLAQSPRLLPQPGRGTPDSSKRVRQVSEREPERKVERVRTISAGTSSRSAHKAALAALPLDKLKPETRGRVEELAKKASIFRELPTLAFEAQPAVYKYFLSHPDSAVSIWRVMQISNFQMLQTGPVTYEADAADGTLGLVEVLLRSDTESVVICNGEYKSPMLTNPIKATALMHLRTHFGQSENGRPAVQHRLTMFVDFPSLTVETAAKMVSPVSNYIVDRNFQEVSVFLYMMSLAMTRRPDWVAQVAGKMDGILEPSRTEFVDLTTQLSLAGDAPVPTAANQPPVAAQSAEPRRLAQEGRASTAR